MQFRFGLKLWLAVHVLSQLMVTVSCANILFFITLANYSHRISMWPLIEALADRGHNVTIFTQHKAKSTHPKVNEFLPKVVQDNNFQGRGASFLGLRFNNEHHNIMRPFVKYAVEFCELILSDSEIRDWIERGNFDLVVIDSLLNDCALGLVYKYKVPHITFSTSAPYAWQYDEMGTIPETSWIPECYSTYPEDMNFLQKMASTIQPLYWYLYKHWYYLPQIEAIIKKHLNLPDLPPLYEIEQNVGVVLMDTYFSGEYPRSLPPSVVPIGGMQCWKTRESKPLPKDIATFIEDGGQDGFIYVSLGSGVRISHLPEASQAMFIAALAKAKTRFIIRWDGDIPKNLPPNVLTDSWLPQQDILSHPSCKGFITHGGGLSIHEAICVGVPAIVVPVFGDQDQNALKLETRGCGIKLEITSFTEEDVSSAISKLLTDNSYKKNMQKASRVFLDRPMNPIHLAVWWTEYVLRHKETPFLKPKGIYQTWYQRRLLDVWLAIFGIVILPVLVLLVIVLKCFSFSKKSRPAAASEKKASSAPVKKSKKKDN